MCVGDIRRVFIPPSLGYGMKGGTDGILGFVSVTMDVELLDHYPRNYSAYYNRLTYRRVELAEFEEREEMNEKHRKGMTAEERKADIAQKERDDRNKGRFRPRDDNRRDKKKNYSPPYDWMKYELENAGAEGYNDEEREKKILIEEGRNRWSDSEKQGKKKREGKWRELSSVLKNRNKLPEIIVRNQEKKDEKDAIEKTDVIVRSQKPIPTILMEQQQKDREKQRERERKKKNTHSSKRNKQTGSDNL